MLGRRVVVFIPKVVVLSHARGRGVPFGFRLGNRRLVVCLAFNKLRRRRGRLGRGLRGHAAPLELTRGGGEAPDLEELMDSEKISNRL